MDFAIQKATELGVAEDLPVYTQHSVVKLEPRPGPAAAHPLATGRRQRVRTVWTTLPTADP